LFWRVKVDGKLDAPIKDCLGFKIERKRKNPDGSWGKTETLRNPVGFTSQPVRGSNNQGFPSQPSSIWPFQRYEWVDHGANNGDTLKYRIIPVAAPVQGVLGSAMLPNIFETKWTQPIKVDPYCTENTLAFFNRGIVISQYVARLARKNNWTPKNILAKVKEVEEPLRRFLSGELRLELLRILDNAIGNPSLSIYAALYELSDRELLDRLKILKKRANIILSNGSNRKGDGNKVARAELKTAKVKVFDRMLGSKGLGHNKFCVLYDNNQNKPVEVWTGSTNWSSTGLCTQANNGILIKDKNIAKLYMDQWKNLKSSGNDFPTLLTNFNTASPYGPKEMEVWFTRVNKPKIQQPYRTDMTKLLELIDHAKKAILYIMFQPGVDILTKILLRSQQQNMYVRGVVNSISDKNKEHFTIMGIKIQSQNYDTAIIQPQGIERNFSSWVKEITRAQFLYPYQNPGIGHAITHSKMIVIDPLDSECKVITGSHNFSTAASEKNDENFVVISHNKPLAEAYSVACLSIYAHYRWRAHVKDALNAKKKPWQYLSDKPAWQDNFISGIKMKHHDYWNKF
jgi:phosphatidylserine/phosphatidylglycerophosphate/cardiolipin synthase-like enzyme